MTPEHQTQTRLWERSRRRAYDEIAAVAMDLFLARGFERTTIDDIARSAGISRRSFFRYFGTKEDAVLGHLVAEGEALRRELERRPDDEDIWDALRGALVAVLDASPDEGRKLAIAQMMYRTPSLRARSVEKHLRWYDDLAPEVERRLGTGPDASVPAKAIVGCVITCLDIAGEAWAEGEGAKPFERYLDAALDAIRRPPSVLT